MQLFWRSTHDTEQLDKDPRFRAYSPEFTLSDHEYPVGCVSWSLDDSVLLTASENRITSWNARVSPLCHRPVFDAFLLTRPHV